jgi:hypothetical protein
MVRAFGLGAVIRIASFAIQNAPTGSADFASKIHVGTGKTAGFLGYCHVLTLFCGTLIRGELSGRSLPVPSYLDKTLGLEINTQILFSSPRKPGEI